MTVTKHPLRHAIQGVLVERTTVACLYADSPHREVVRCHGNMSQTSYWKFVMISQDTFELNTYYKHSHVGISHNRIKQK